MLPKVSPLLQQVANREILLDENFVDICQASLEHLASHEHAEELMRDLGTYRAANDDDFWPQPDSWEAQYRPYNVVDGVLQIPIQGVLLNRFSYQFGRWATGYTYIEKALARGLADANVKKIALISHSGGGEVAGCMELADKIYEARKQKPIRAFAADFMYSAAYALGSSGKEIRMTRSGGVGSIGVMTMHVEYSKSLEAQGIKVTLKYKGDHKVDANVYEPLSKQAEARIDKRIEKLYAVFVGLVARNRGLEESAVRATQALTYDADEAVEVGLADGVGEIENEMAIFASEPVTGDEQMAFSITQEDHEKAVATARAEGKAEGVKEGTVAGHTAAQERIAAILDSDEAKTRPAAARMLAFDTDKPADAAKASLAKLPAENAQVEQTTETKPQGDKTQGKTDKTPFEKMMESEQTPNVGADNNKGGDKDEDEGAGEGEQANAILDAFGAAAGIPKKTA